MNLAIRCRLGLRVVDPVDELRTNLLSMQVDRGEASAIALALEYLDHVVILDDRKAHILAEALGLVVAGTLGVIVKAKQNGAIALVRPWFDRLREAGFRASDAVEAALLKEAGEQ